MEKKLVNDLTEGNILKQIIGFSIPMMLGSLLQMLYNTVDSIWVGRFLGPEALGAVSVSFPVIFALVAAIMGLAMGTTTMVSQYAGARQFDMVKKTVNNSIVVQGGAGILASILGVALHRPLLHLINTPANLIPLASQYMVIFLGGLIFMFGTNIFGGILRGLGDSRTPLLFLLYATVTNVILDPLLIFGWGPFPRMGVAGAALATVFSQGVSTVLAVRYLNRRQQLLQVRLADLRFDWELTRVMLRIGLPAGVQQSLISLGGLAVSSIINGFGATVVAGYGAAAKLDHFASIPYVAVGAAVTALVGQNMGAGNKERVRETVYWATIIAVSTAALFNLIAFFAPRVALLPFTTDAGVIAAGETYLRVVGFSYIPFALYFVITGVLRGAGDTVPPMFISLINLWVIRVPLARILSRSPALGVSGVWLAVALSSLMGMILSRLYYATGRWKDKAIVKHRTPALVPALPGDQRRNQDG